MWRRGTMCRRPPSISNDGISMIYITEEESSAVKAIRSLSKRYAALIAISTLDTNSFPMVIGYGSDKANYFTIKLRSSPFLPGLKVGSYLLEQSFEHPKA